jgi:uncharacterized protein
MTKEETIDRTKAFVEQKFSGENTGHDWWHMYRVWKLARHIAASEPTADPFVTEIAALLHDIADWKFHDGDMEAGPKAAREWLETLDVDNDVIEHVEDIIRNVSFKGAKSENKLSTLEGKIVHDADKLDAIGAIGIARVFAMSAIYKEAFYDPSVPVPTYTTAAAYQSARDKSGRTVINHFHEKLLLLKDRMFTNMGKQLAIARHEYMVGYLQEFQDEWDIEK